MFYINTVKSRKSGRSYTKSYKKLMERSLELVILLKKSIKIQELFKKSKVIFLDNKAQNQMVFGCSYLRLPR